MGLIAFLVLILVAVVVVIVYAAQNSAAQTVHLWQYHWTGVPSWIPVAIAAALVAALFILYLAVAGTGSRLERGRLRRRLRDLEADLEKHRTENEQLRGRVRALEGDAQQRAQTPVSPEQPGPAGG